MIFNIYKIFFKIGSMAIGGGYTMLPIMQDELVARNRLLTEKQLLNFYLLGQSFPGTILVNVSAFIGYHLDKGWGAVSAVLGAITPAFLIMSALTSLIVRVGNSSLLRDIFATVTIALIALIIVNVVALAKRYIKTLYNVFTFVLSLLLLIWGISPLIVVIINLGMAIMVIKLAKLNS